MKKRLFCLKLQYVYAFLAFFSCRCACYEWEKQSFSYSFQQVIHIFHNSIVENLTEDNIMGKTFFKVFPMIDSFHPTHAVSGMSFQMIG